MRQSRGKRFLLLTFPFVNHLLFRHILFVLTLMLKTQMIYHRRCAKRTSFFSTTCYFVIANETVNFCSVDCVHYEKVPNFAATSWFRHFLVLNCFGNRP